MNEAKRNADLGFVLMGDGDGHYYMVPCEHESRFSEWCCAMENDHEWEGVDYEQFRVDGPHAVQILEWRERE